MTFPAADDLHAYVAFAQRLADAARPIALRYFLRPLAVETKSDASPVTVVDREIETELRRLIRAEHPAHGILGEEFGAQEGSEYTWVLDPIDGTRSFICGNPLFGTLIALLHDGTPVLGVIDIPALGERWTGAAEMPTLFNGAAARTSACARIADARVSTTTPDSFSPEDWTRYERVSRMCATRRFGGDCYAYGLLASGHCDLVIEAGLQPYDHLALVAVIEGAGGRVTDWRGNALGPGSDGRVVAASTTALWEQALEALASL